MSTATIASISKTAPPGPQCKPKPSRAAPKVLQGALWHGGKISASHQLMCKPPNPSVAAVPERHVVPHKVRIPLCSAPQRAAPLSGTVLGVCCLSGNSPAPCKLLSLLPQHCGTQPSTTPPQIFSTSVPEWLHGKHLPWNISVQIQHGEDPAPPHTHQFGSDTVAQCSSVTGVNAVNTYFEKSL